MTTDELVNEVLCRLRLSRPQLAHLLGVSRQAIYSWLVGRRPGDVHLILLTRMLEASADPVQYQKLSYAIHDALAKPAAPGGKGTKLDWGKAQSDGAGGTSVGTLLRTLFGELTTPRKEKRNRGQDHHV